MKKALAVAAIALLGACANQAPLATPATEGAGPPAVPQRAPYASLYVAPLQSAPVLIRNASILTGTGRRIDNDGELLLERGRITAVGRGLAVPPGATIVDAAGRWVTPGLIDVHSHLGVYPSPELRAHQDGNEATDPITGGVWVEHSLWPQDPGFERALAGGVTTLQILPGSANLIGGRGVTVKNVWARTYQEMKFPGAPQSLKMACGENPKRVYGGRQRAPATRMGNVAGYRQAFADARDYQEQWKDHDAKRAAFDKVAKPDATPPKPPKRDLRLETLAAAMQGELPVHVHCYRADEMAIMLDLAREFGFRITAFHHGTEAYKLAERLAEEGVCGALWADWWGFKLEAYDAIQENIAFVDHPSGGCAIVHSDSAEGIQRLNQEAAKAMARGVRAGFDIPSERAIRWLTANPAKSMGILAQTGTLEVGKMADVVVWSGHPLSVYARADLVYIDGVLRFDRARPAAVPRSDFEQ